MLSNVAELSIYTRVNAYWLCHKGSRPAFYNIREESAAAGIKKGITSTLSNLSIAYFLHTSPCGRSRKVFFEVFSACFSRIKVLNIISSKKICNFF